MRKREELANPDSCINRALPDEMVFVLLGRDAASSYAVREWAKKRVELGLNQWHDQQILDALATTNIIEAEIADVRAKVKRAK